MSKKLFLLSVLLGFCAGVNAQKDADEYTTDQPSVTIITTNLKKQWQLTVLFNGKSKTKPWIDRNNNGKYDAGEESIKKREFDISSMQLFCFYQLSLCSFLASLATDCMQ